MGSAARQLQRTGVALSFGQIRLPWLSIYLQLVEPHTSAMPSRNGWSLLNDGPMTNEPVLPI